MSTGARSGVRGQGSGDREKANRRDAERAQRKQRKRFYHGGHGEHGENTERKQTGFGVRESGFGKKTERDIRLRTIDNRALTLDF